MNKKSLIIIVICVTFLFSLKNIKAENFLPNGSFEVTTVPDMPDCWDQPFGPKEIKNWYSLWKIDESIAFQGKKSLCIAVPSHSSIWKLYAQSWYQDWLIRLWKNKLKKLEKNQYYTLSMYLKSNKLKFPVSVIIRTAKKVYRFKTKVSFIWKRYFFTFYLNSQLKNVRIYPLGVGKLWIDAVKLEKGKEATKFTPSPYNTYFVNLPKPKKVNEIEKELAKLGWEERFNYPKVKPKFLGNINIDPIQRCILVNGKPFFFFAACFMRAHLYKKRWNELLRMLKRYEYTAVIASFACSWNDSHASTPEIRRFLNLAYRCGLKVVIWIQINAVKTSNGFKRIRHNFPPRVITEEYKKEIKRLIPPLKNHPALLGWYLFDEPYEKELINYGFTKKIVDFAKSLDPCHFMYINYGKLEKDYKFYNGKIPGDIVSRTQYPIPVYPITYIAEQTGKEYIIGNFRKPVVLWLQLWSGKGRYPTPDEFTCMAYLAAIYGATGFQTWPMMPGSKLLWDRVKVVISEMKEISSVLYSRNTIPVVIKGSDYIHTMAKKLGKKVYLLAVNTLNKKQDVTFVLPDLKIKKINVKFESRFCSFKDNLFNDVFKPYERHVYEIDLGF